MALDHDSLLKRLFRTWRLAHCDLRGYISQHLQGTWWRCHNSMLCLNRHILLLGVPDRMPLRLLLCYLALLLAGLSHCLPPLTSCPSSSFSVVVTHRLKVTAPLFLIHFLLEFLSWLPSGSISFNKPFSSARMHLAMIFLTGTESQVRRHIEPIEKALSTLPPVYDWAGHLHKQMLDSLLYHSYFCLSFWANESGNNQGMCELFGTPTLQFKLAKGDCHQRLCIHSIKETVGKQLPRMYKNLRSMSCIP